MNSTKVILSTGAATFLLASFFLVDIYQSPLPLNFNPRFTYFMMSLIGFLCVCAYQILQTWNKVEVKYIRKKTESLPKDYKRIRNFSELITFLKTKGHFHLGHKLEGHMRELERSALSEVNNENPSISAFNEGLKNSLQDVQKSIVKLSSSVKYVESEQGAIERFEQTVSNLLERVLQLEMESHQINQKVASYDQIERLEKKINMMASQMNRIEINQSSIAPTDAVMDIVENVDFIEEVISEVLSNLNSQGKLESYQVKVAIENEKLAITRSEFYAKINDVLESLLLKSSTIEGKKIIKITSARNDDTYKLFNKVLLSDACDDDLVYQRTEAENLYNAYNDEGEVVGRLQIDNFSVELKDERQEVRNSHKEVTI